MTRYVVTCPSANSIVVKSIFDPEELFQGDDGLMHATITTNMDVNAIKGIVNSPDVVVVPAEMVPVTFWERLKRIIVK